MSIPKTPSAGSRCEHHRRAFLAFVIVAWGLQAIVVQSLLLREALVLMFGSEFAWGVVLFAWLFGVAAGAGLGGWWADRLQQANHPKGAVAGLVIALLGLSVVGCLDLWVFRGARSWLGVAPGELLPLPKTALSALLFVSPGGAFVGAAFPLACCIRGGTEPRALAPAEPPGEQTHARRGGLSLASIYALESAGSLVGGAVFSFWAVEHLAPIQTAMICGAITVAFLAGWLRFSGRERYGSFGLAALAALILTLSVVAGDALEAKLIERRWQSIAPGYELCAQAESRYQNLAIGRRVEQFTLYSDGQVTSDFPDPYTFVPLAHFFLCQHPSPRKVLVLGGGAEGLLAEILEHGVEHVDYVEPDPRQIALIEPFLTERDLQALTDARVTVHHVDGRYFIKTQADHAEYDLVLARLPEPMSALRARYYTKEFYGELRRTMTARSVLCTTAAATPGQLSAASAEYLASIRATLQPSFPHVTVGWGNPAHILAATEDGLISTDPATLVQRYAEHGARSEWFDPAWFDGAVDWLDPSKLQQRAAQLDAVADAQISTDLHPSLYVRRLDLWERMTSGTPHGAMTRLRSTGWVDVVVALAAISGLTLLACYLRARRQRVSPLTQVQSRAPWFSNGAIVLSIASTGLATMALSIVWLFAFQNLYGYVYQRIGWIIALFMAGLVLGCGLTDRRLKRLTNGESSIPHLWQGLIVVDALMAFLAITVPFLLPALGALQTSPVALTFVEWCVSFMVAVTGAFGGAAFAVAARLHLALTGRAGATAGSIVGADHAGACLGALLSGILLVPVFGIAATAWLLAGVKFSSVSLLAVARRLSREG